jgi:hypothetical protein
VTRATDREVFFSEEVKTPEVTAAAVPMPVPAAEESFGKISSPAVASFLKEVSDLADTPFSQDWARLDKEIALASSTRGSAPALEDILSEANARLSTQQRAEAEAKAAKRRDESEVEIMTGSFARITSSLPVAQPAQDEEEDEEPAERSRRTEIVPAARASYGDLVEDAPNPIEAALNSLSSAPPPDFEQEPLPPSRPHRPSGFIIRKIKPAIPTLPGLQPVEQAEASEATRGGDAASLPRHVRRQTREAAPVINMSDDGEETCRFTRAAAGGMAPIEEMARPPTSRRGVLPTTTARLR